MTKQGRRNLRHARIGQPDSNRRALTRESMKSRLLCIEFQLNEGAEPEEIFFRPLPSSRVLELQGLSGKDAISVMLNLVAEFVVDPMTGEPLATAEDWDAFGIDGIQAIVSAMTEGARGDKGQREAAGEGPTTASGVDAAALAALEIMQADPAIAAAFQRASEIYAEKPAAAEAGTETEAQENPQNSNPDQVPDGMSGETH